MKTIYKLFVLCCLLAVYNVQAQQVITVSNRPGDIADFNTIGDAIEAASDGDIIYVSGSTNSYGSFQLNKRLTLIGTGHNPDTADGLVSQLGTITLQEGSSESEIIGFSIGSISWSSSSDEINNIKVQRNNISFQLFINANSKEWIIEDNILNTISGSAAITFEENLIIRNNIIRGNVSNVQFSLFTNNVFTGTGGVLSSNTQNNSIINNIFFQNNLNGSFNANQIQNCTFNNNIFFGPNNPTSLPPGNQNTGANNIFANPLFVNVPSNNFSYDHDFNLQASSPGINAGTDGTDIGVYGGAGFSESGEPAIPQVTQFNILNPSVPQNGNLNVRIEGRANN